MPKYSGMADFVSTNLNQPSRAAAIEFNSLSTPEPYYYGVYGPALGWDELEPRVREADQVYFTTYAPDQIALFEAGRLTQTSEGALPDAVIFDDVAALQQTDLSLCAQRLLVRLNWSAAPASGDGAHVRAARRGGLEQRHGREQLVRQLSSTGLKLGKRRRGWMEKPFEYDHCRIEYRMVVLEESECLFCAVGVEVDLRHHALLTLVILGQ